MIATSSRFILFLGKTVWGGKYHDFTLLKEEFNKEQVFEDHQVWVDLAYVGFSKYYKTKKLHLPYKKPRKTKTRPDPKLTDFQKQSNKQKSQVRIVVEHGPPTRASTRVRHCRHETLQDSRGAIPK